MCHRGAACPYPHINVDDNARVCLNFQQGYCARGAECTLKHVKEASGNSEIKKLELIFVNFAKRKKLPKNQMN